MAHGSKYVERGSESRLVIDNVTYEYQGEYECRATSYINGQERVAISDPVSLQVVGKSLSALLVFTVCGVAIKTAIPQNMTTTRLVPQPACFPPDTHRILEDLESRRGTAKGMASRPTGKGIAG